MTVKRCARCKLNKPLSEFYSEGIKSRNRFKKNSYCKACTKEYKKSLYSDPKNYEKEKIRWREKHLRRSFGITLEQYESLFKKQDGRCAICGRYSPTNRLLAVDHNHATNVIRGLLCSKCNVALGLFEENKTSLENAISYLERSS